MAPKLPSRALLSAPSALCLVWFLATSILLAPPAEALPEIDVLTDKENPSITADLVVLRIRGKIERGFAEKLLEVWSGLHPRYDRLLLDLDSPGGDLEETEEVVRVLADIRRTATVETLVDHGSWCASACVAIFVQGERRFAGGASIWLFHGACRAQSNVPSLSLTDRFLQMLRERGVSEEFLCDLVEKGYVTTAGRLWVSGYELFHIYDANIITVLLKPWQPEQPYLWPADPMIRPR